MSQKLNGMSWLLPAFNHLRPALDLPTWRTSSASAEKQAPLIAIMDNHKRETIMDNPRAISRKSWSHVGTSAPSLSILASSIGPSSMNNGNSITSSSSPQEGPDTHLDHHGAANRQNMHFPLCLQSFLIAHMRLSWSIWDHHGTNLRPSRWPDGRNIAPRYTKKYKKTQKTHFGASWRGQHSNIDFPRCS